MFYRVGRIQIKERHSHCKNKTMDKAEYHTECRINACGSHLTEIDRSIRGMANAGTPKILPTSQNIEVPSPSKPKTPKVGVWEEQVAQAKANLSVLGKPTVAEVSKLASLRYAGKDNTGFLDAYKTLKTPTADITDAIANAITPLTEAVSAAIGAEPQETVVEPTTAPINPPAVSTKPASRKKKKIVIVNELQDPVEQMRMLYKLRAKKPKQYVYSPEGELQDSTNEQPSVRLRPFSSLTPEERQEIEEKRKSDLDAAEEVYENALLELRSALDLFEGDPSGPVLPVVRANQKVREASKIRSSLAYPLKTLDEIENPEIRRVILSEIYEKRMMGYDVFLLKRRDMIKEDYLGHYRDFGVQQGGGANTQEEQQQVLFITDPDNKETGLFHPAFPAEFNFDGTRYSSVYQAYEGERFKELNNEIIRKQILGTRSSRTIHALVANEQVQPKDPRGLWQDILQAFYDQQKDAAQKLLATGSAKFHLMDKEIGNQIYIDALESTRIFLREHDGLPMINNKAATVITESVITEDDQKKARTGAVINNFRRRG